MRPREKKVVVIGRPGSGWVLIRCINEREVADKVVGRRQNGLVVNARALARPITWFDETDNAVRQELGAHQGAEDPASRPSATGAPI